MAGTGTRKKLITIGRFDSQGAEQTCQWEGGEGNRKKSRGMWAMRVGYIKAQSLSLM